MLTQGFSTSAVLTFGAGNSLLWETSVHCRMFSKYDNQMSPQEENCPLLRMTDLAQLLKYKQPATGNMNMHIIWYQCKL